MPHCINGKRLTCDGLSARGVQRNPGTAGGLTRVGRKAPALRRGDIPKNNTDSYYDVTTIKEVFRPKTSKYIGIRMGNYHSLSILRHARWTLEAMGGFPVSGNRNVLAWRTSKPDMAAFLSQYDESALLDELILFR